ncbi:hypothetical protein EG329_007405 [Mollisiaceae sp. DMI_Dod_QoI]|nr:hypothetical protein EG329_007405 [Helotiales sp. DMI_Dod_QoI]
MARDIIEQVAPHIREIIRICRVLDIEGRELHKLNELVGRTIQNHLVELNKEAGSPCPITFEFKRLRRSGRQSSETKRCYEDMQSANSRTNKLHKKPKLAANRSATDESAANEFVDDSPIDDSSNNIPPTNLPPTNDPPNDKPPNKPTTFETTKDPGTMNPLETLGEAPSIASLVDGDETHVDSAAERDLPTITHTDGMVILDEYFPKSATDSRPLNSAVLDEMPTSVADALCQDSPLPLIQSYSPEALTLPPSTGSNDALFKVSDTVDPKHAGSGFETSISSVGSPESESSCTDLSSNPTSETNAADLELPDAVTHTSFARRLVLDETDQSLDCVLVALENIYDDRRNPNSSIPGVLDNVLTKDNHTTFVKIMTSVTENWA